MKNEGEEFEIKLELDEAGMKALADCPALKALAVKPPRQRELSSTYFDTSDHRLHTASIAFRIRDTGGSLIQTIKQGAEMRGGISNPIEIEAPVKQLKPDPDAIADPAMLAQLEALAEFSELRPIFSTDIDRGEYELVLNGTRAELALDTGQIRSPRKVRPICEAELELKSGDIDGFLEMAARLFANVTIKFATASKAQKGYLQLARASDAVLKPAKAWQPKLDADSGVANSFALVCQSTCDQILKNWAGLLTENDPEFAHQLRVGLRRQRSALRVFRGAVDNEALQTLNQELGHIGRVVGALRNLDVMVDDILHPALEHAPQPTVTTRLQKLIANLCTRERRMVKHELRLQRWNPLLLKLALLPYGAGWERHISARVETGEFAQQAIQACWNQVKKRADRLEQLSDEKRHRLRKDLKVLRYAIEFFASILPSEKTKAFLRQLRSLQDRFGYLNDVALARTLPEMLGAEEAGDPELGEAIGFVLGWHSSRATRELAEAAKQWKRLKRLAKPWK